MRNSLRAEAVVKSAWGADAEDTPIEAESAVIENRLRDLPDRLRQGLIIIDQDDDEDEEEHEREAIPALADIIDLTDDAPGPEQRSKDQPVRNPPIPSHESLKFYYLDGLIKIERGSTVEIQALEQPQLFKTSFLHVQHIFRTSDGVKLHGIPLTRMRNLRGRLPRLRNEVAMILHVDNDDKRPEEVQAAIEVSVADVIRIRHCHFTNADFPQHRTVLGIHKSITDLEQHGVLMCRWRCIFRYRNSATRIAHFGQTKSKGRCNAAPVEYVIEHLNAKQASKKRFEVSEAGRFNVWRGGKVRGGDYDPENKNSPITGPLVQLDTKADSEVVLIEKKPGQKYTFGDMFCGAGGASCGAQKAGFHIKIACDHHLGACRTYSKVFPEADLVMSDIFDFITRDTAKTRVDVLHLSPPCQFWSPAHTCAGANDDANIAVLFSCHELIRELRPRIFTLEQTFGILLPKFEYYFNALVHGFTRNDYSVRWKVVDLVDWGSPAARKRLVMIGSCPGEALPPFPRATHVAPGGGGKGTGKWKRRRRRRSHVTVAKMLGRIPRDAWRHDDMHRPREMARKRLARWDADVTLRRCITTNGGYGNYHPSGRRDFTLREYATLQTFPVGYPFQNPDRKRQIGNAFPPKAVKALYAHLRGWLEGQDRVYAVENEPVDRDDPDVSFFDLGSSDDEDDDGDEDEDVEYVGSQRLPSPSIGSNRGGDEEEEESDEDMDLDYGPCIDVNQGPHVWPPIDLTTGDDDGGSGGTDDNARAWVDLTGEDK